MSTTTWFYRYRRILVVAGIVTAGVAIELALVTITALFPMLQSIRTEGISTSPPDYPSEGFDTLESYVDRRFQLKRDGWIGLLDAVDHHTIMCPIVDYSRHGHWLYAVSDRGVYLVFDTETGDYSYCQQPDDAEPEHRSSLARLRSRRPG